MLFKAAEWNQSCPTPTMAKVGPVKTSCSMCQCSGPRRCGLDVYTEDGKVVAIKGTKESPVSRGRVCAKGLAARDVLYHPDRLKYPLRREGENWLRISWDEALGTIASKLNELKQEYGPESLSYVSGVLEMSTVEPFIARFMNLYGTPNVGSFSELCVGPKVLADRVTFGARAFRTGDIGKSSCILLWGMNPPSSYPVGWKGILSARKRGAKLIVIDPRTTAAAAAADLHLKLLPGSDGALALGMLNVIITEKLYDKEFVDKWTTGFERLRESVEAYPPEKVEVSTSLPAKDIEEAARTYATYRPAYMGLGNALDVTCDSFQTLRAAAILRAITGNVDVPGGNSFDRVVPLADVSLRERLPADVKPISAEEYPLATEEWGAVPSGVFVKAILGGKPYPIRAMIVDYCNPALTWCDTETTVKALKKLEFLVVMDVFMSETAKLADIVLPAATFLETSRLYSYSSEVPREGGNSFVLWGEKAVEPEGECWPDWKFWFELARRMGYEAEFPWKDIEGAADVQLGPTGLTVEDLKRHPSGIYVGPRRTYRDFERDGFATPSGKVEIFSKVLEGYGYAPLPTMASLSRSRGRDEEGLPLLLTTGAKTPAFSHSSWHQLPRLKAINPEPLAEVHRRTAEKLGISDGDYVTVETQRGRIRIRVLLTDSIHPCCVSVPHGWTEANCNLLTDLEVLDPVTGSPNMRAIQCRISKCP